MVARSKQYVVENVVSEGRKFGKCQNACDVFIISHHLHHQNRRVPIDLSVESRRQILTLFIVIFRFA